VFIAVRTYLNNVCCQQFAISGTTTSYFIRTECMCTVHTTLSGL